MQRLFVLIRSHATTWFIPSIPSRGLLKCWSKSFVFTRGHLKSDRGNNLKQKSQWRLKAFIFSSFLVVGSDMLGSSADLSSMEGMVYDSSGTNGSASGGGGGGGSSSQQQQQQQRTKRMRTSFKHHQLRTMKSYFAINQNPDAKDLKQLAQKTGLSKRVLQVKVLCIRPNTHRQALKNATTILSSLCTSKKSIENIASGRVLLKSRGQYVWQYLIRENAAQ